MSVVKRKGPMIVTVDTCNPGHGAVSFSYTITISSGTAVLTYDLTGALQIPLFHHPRRHRPHMLSPHARQHEWFASM